MHGILYIEIDEMIFENSKGANNKGIRAQEKLQKNSYLILECGRPKQRKKIKETKTVDFTKKSFKYQRAL